MAHIFVGASVSADAAPCYDMAAWDALLAAMDRGDHEAVIRITTGTTPMMIPTAQLQVVEPTPPKTLKDAADQFWSKRGKSGPNAHATDPSGTVPIVLEVPR